MAELERPADRPLRSLVAFWLLAILVSWGAGMGVVLSTQAAMVNGVHVRSGAIPLPFALTIVLLLVSGSGPGIAAIAVRAVEDGIGGVGALLSQVLRWRAGPGWYAVALLLPMSLTVLATVIWAVATGSRPGRWLPLPTAFQILALPLFPWGEEIGWRGFAQPRLQAGLAWLPASVVVGVMWGLWHQWPLLTFSANGPDPVGLGLFFVYIISEAILIGWVYNRGGRKLPLGWAGHAGLNAVGPTSVPFGLVAVMFAVAAGAVGLLARRSERGEGGGRRGWTPRPSARS